jgi:predicted metalloprotease
VAVAVTDIERWWAEQFPAIYGEAFEPLEGGLYAGYPERDTDLPGCGEPVTSYSDLELYGAFYCSIGDFMVYDDGDAGDSLLTPLANEYGAAVLGVVLAHEYGHAIQARSGALDRALATVVTEQQADCFAGAWTGQAYRGDSAMLRLGDRDVRTGLIAMLSVSDPVGTNQFTAGGHGSAFDRVGAFQLGFVSGATRCADLLDSPLTLMPNQFQPFSLDELLGGDAAYDCDDLIGTPGITQEIIDSCTDAPIFLADDLNDFWATVLGAAAVALTPLAVDDLVGLTCASPTPITTEVVLCVDEATVAYDEPAVLDLYRDFGDFTLGYFYGIAWAEHAQVVSGSAASGEQRALLNDCYAGAWVRDITPDETGRTGRTTSDVSSSPGDLDEAIRMAILVGDEGASVDRVGSPFEKIESFRVGVLGGIEACQARFPS